MRRKPPVIEVAACTGEFWRGILEKFEQFGNLPGSTLIRPGQAPYRIPVVNGVAIFPWRYGRNSEGDLTATPFLTSDAREAIFDLSDVEVQQEFDLGLTRPELTPEEQGWPTSWSRRSEKNWSPRGNSLWSQSRAR